MNYFAHGRLYINDPYFLAGTALPDWLNVIDRGIRARAKYARLLVEDADERLASVALGVVQHHHDDGWFHGTRAFAELSLFLTKTVRQRLPLDDGMRPSFLGHILVEILLDSELAAAEPGRLDAYYEALAAVDAELVAEAVFRMTGKPAKRLVELVPRFCAERFLSDYAQDAKLCFRLNQVLRRVKLPPLPEDFAEILPDARREVAQRQIELLTPMENTP